MSRTRKRVLYVMPESTYGTDPDADGSDYMMIPSLELGDIKDLKEPVPTNYFVGRAHGGTPPIATGRDGWSFDVTVPLFGMASAAGDGVNASSVTDDWLDAIFSHIFAAKSTKAGVGVLSSASAQGVVLDSDVDINEQDMLGIYQASVPIKPRLQINQATNASGATYTGLHPGFSDYGTTPVTTAGISYGYKLYEPSDAGGLSLAFAYVQDSVTYTLLGGRCTACSIKMESPGQIWKMALSFAGDTKITTGKGSLDTPAHQAYSPVVGLLSPVWFASTAYVTSSCEINLNIVASELPSTASDTGRAGYESISMAPTISITPMYSDAITVLRRAATTGRLLIQLGAGVLASSRINAIGICAEQAYVQSSDVKDDAGRNRQSVTLAVSDDVNYSSVVASKFFQVARF